ncbi:MAG TPA: hypothetical protein VFC02_06400 [Anaerolineales bacterium]|nr:hypothetical protein [Anaerolineales bacterium]
MSYTPSSLPQPTNNNWNFTFSYPQPTTENCYDGYVELKEWMSGSNTSQWFYEDGKMNAYLVQCVCGSPGCTFNCGGTPSCQSAANPNCNSTPPPPPPPPVLPTDNTPTQPVTGAYILGNPNPTCADVESWLNRMITEYGDIATANSDEPAFLSNYNVYLTQCAGQPANTILPGYYSTAEQKQVAQGGFPTQFQSPDTLAAYYGLGDPTWTFTAADQNSAKDVACANAFMALQQATRPGDVTEWVEAAGNNAGSWQKLEQGTGNDAFVAQLTNQYIANGCGSYTPPTSDTTLFNFWMNHPILAGIGAVVGGATSAFLVGTSLAVGTKPRLYAFALGAVVGYVAMEKLFIVVGDSVECMGSFGKVSGYWVNPWHWFSHDNPPHLECSFNNL